MFQKITLIGHLGRDPEMRFMPDGRPVTNFSVATNRRWTTADGSPGEETIWFRVSCWGRLAEVTAEHLAKGRMVYIEGRMRGPNAYLDNEGQARASLDVTAMSVQFLDKNGSAKMGEPDSSDVVLPQEEDLPF